MVEPGSGSPTTTYNYSSTTGQLTSIVNPYTETTSFTYDSLGRLDKKTLANGTREEYAYDARSRVTDIVLKGGSGYATTVRSQNYTYDDASNVLTYTTGGVTTTYGYDDIDQLISESRSGYSASYSYDGNGNRLTRTVNGTTEDYAYDDADKLQTVKIGTTTIKSFTYDEAGRTTRQTTSAGNTDYAFDEESRITGITFPNSTTSAYSYNGLDTRISKTENSTTTNYRRMGAGVTAPVLSDGTNNFTPGISSRAGSTSTFGFSGIKNGDAQVNSSGNVGPTRTYDAFGNVVNSSGTWQGPFGYGGDYGYQSDEVSGLKLLGHRYYDSSIGRFLTRDAAKDGKNWYAYCGNNPVCCIDANGLKKVVIVVGEGYPDEEVFPERFLILAKLIKEYLEANGDTVVILYGPTQSTLEHSLSSADALVYIGHGVQNGGQVNQGRRNKWDAFNLTPALVGRARKGKPQLDYVILVTCDMLATDEALKGWWRVSKLVFGFTDVDSHVQPWIDSWLHWIGNKGAASTYVDKLPKMNGRGGPIRPGYLWR